MYDLRDLIIFLTQINTAFGEQGGAEGGGGKDRRRKPHL